MYQSRKHHSSSPYSSSTIINRTIRVLYELLGELLTYSLACCPKPRRDSGIHLDKSTTFSEKLSELKMDSRLNTTGQAMEDTGSGAPDTGHTSSAPEVRSKHSPPRSSGHHPHIDSQKLDMILANTQSIQTSQREVYNMLKALVSRVSKVDTSGPTNHLEVVQLSKKQQDNPYLKGLIKRRRN